MNNFEVADLIITIGREYTSLTLYIAMNGILYYLVFLLRWLIPRNIGLNNNSVNNSKLIGQDTFVNVDSKYFINVASELL